MTEPASTAMIAAQMDAVFDDIAEHAVRLGMLGGAEAVATAPGQPGRATGRLTSAPCAADSALMQIKAHVSDYS